MLIKSKCLNAKKKGKSLVYTIGLSQKFNFQSTKPDNRDHSTIEIGQIRTNLAPYVVFYFVIIKNIQIQTKTFISNLFLNKKHMKWVSKIF